MTNTLTFDDILEQSGAAEGRHGVVPAAEPPLEEVLAEYVAQALSPDNLNKLLTRGIKKRRSAPIHGYNGLNGQFKTWAMVRDALPSLALGRRVLSTVAILDPESGNPHPLYTPFSSWSQFNTFRDGDILLDEITAILDSREQGMPRPVRRKLPQMRRENTRVAWTGIDWDNSDRRLRQLTWSVTKCRGHMPNYKLQRMQTRDAPAELSMWAPNRLAFLTTYDSSTLMKSEDSKQLNFELGGPQRKVPRARVLVRELSWAPTSLTFKCYNTLDQVLSVDNTCLHGLDVPKLPLCKDPQCFADHHSGWNDEGVA